jgi:hypothetical protein
VCRPALIIVSVDASEVVLFCELPLYVGETRYDRRVLDISWELGLRLRKLAVLTPDAVLDADRFSLFEVGDRLVALQDNPLTIYVYFGCRPALSEQLPLFPTQRKR